MTACDYPHPVKLEQGVGLHYKPFRLFRLTPILAIQPLVRAIFFYLASNPRSRAKQGQWRKSDIAYPVLGAMAFGISTTLRKSGLNEFPNPLLAAAVTVGTAFLVLCAIVHFGFGRRALQFNHQGSGWLFAAALLNAGAILSLFFALNIGKIVEVEPLVACNPLLTLLWTAVFLRGIERLSRRIVISAIATVAGTVLVITAH
jgi:uncharacterized membrane protein